MKSKMINCNDYRQLPVADDLRRWKIADSEILEELEALARDHSGEQRISGQAKSGDSLRLVCREASREGWKERPVLLFPGRGLPGAGEAEQAVLGKQAGDTIRCEINGTWVVLEIEEIRRRRTMRVGEELIAVLGIPGVHSVEDYKRWYRKEHDGERRKKAWIRIVQYWLTEISAHSEFMIDEEEKRQWCLCKGRLFYQGMLAVGIDLCKPTGEHPRGLTREEAITAEAEKQERYFIPYLIYSYFCEKDGFFISEEDFLEEIRKIAAERGMDVEEARRQSDIQLYREVKYQEHTFYLLGKEAEVYLED